MLTIAYVGAHALPGNATVAELLRSSLMLSGSSVTASTDGSRPRSLTTPPLGWWDGLRGENVRGVLNELLRGVEGETAPMAEAAAAERPTVTEPDPPAAGRNHQSTSDTERHAGSLSDGTVSMQSIHANDSEHEYRGREMGTPPVDAGRRSPLLSNGVTHQSGHENHTGAETIVDSDAVAAESSVDIELDTYDYPPTADEA